MTLQNAIEMIRNLRDCEVEAVKIFNDEPYDDRYTIDRIRKSMARVSKGKVSFLESFS